LVLENRGSWWIASKVYIKGWESVIDGGRFAGLDVYGLGVSWPSRMLQTDAILADQQIVYSHRRYSPSHLFIGIGDLQGRTRRRRID
jgi:hypothetical protein